MVRLLRAWFAGFLFSTYPSIITFLSGKANF